MSAVRAGSPTASAGPGSLGARRRTARRAAGSSSTSGGITLFLFLVQVASGILLAALLPARRRAGPRVGRSASSARSRTATSSATSTSGRSDLFVACLLAHLFTVVVRRSFRPPHELTWLSGHRRARARHRPRVHRRHPAVERARVHRTRASAASSRATCPSSASGCTRFMRGGDGRRPEHARARVRLPRRRAAGGAHAARRGAPLPRSRASRRSPADERRGATTIPLYPDFVVRQAVALTGRHRRRHDARDLRRPAARRRRRSARSPRRRAAALVLPARPPDRPRVAARSCSASTARASSSAPRACSASSSSRCRSSTGAAPGSPPGSRGSSSSSSPPGDQCAHLAPSLAAALAVLRRSRSPRRRPPSPAAAASAPERQRGPAGARTPALADRGDATNTCASCHATLTDDQAARAREGVPRTASTATIASAASAATRATRAIPPSARTRGRRASTPHPTHAEVPEICGGCHSDAAFMRHINARLPVGQAGALQPEPPRQAHRRRRRPTRPSCADCHGKHDILPPVVAALAGQPRRTSRSSAAAATPTRSGWASTRSRRTSSTKWEQSVHGQAFRKGNPNAPTCTGCHGAHSATPPDASSVARACGRCHEEEMKFFEQSPHSKGFRKRGLARVRRLPRQPRRRARRRALLVGTTPDATCMKCHSHDDKPRKVAERASPALLRGARARGRGGARAVSPARAPRASTSRGAALRARPARDGGARAARRRAHARSGAGRGARRRRRRRRRARPRSSSPTPSRSGAPSAAATTSRSRSRALLFVSLGAQDPASSTGGGGRRP